MKRASGVHNFNPGIKINLNHPRFSLCCSELSSQFRIHPEVGFRTNKQVDAKLRLILQISLRCQHNIIVHVSICRSIIKHKYVRTRCKEEKDNIAICESRCFVSSCKDAPVPEGSDTSFPYRFWSSSLFGSSHRVSNWYCLPFIFHDNALILILQLANAP